ncbi:MAG TPA: TraR/DksA C4-type zinc finger protein [Euzebyales bacterium]|jgi:DnaK suppressor protein|nr:TraR/DksA C4-type zinc finger protein [Euzebyales bacterium]
MDEQLQQRLRSELESHRQELVSELRSLGADPDRDRVQKLTGIDDNFADSASATTERAETLALVQQARERLTDIDHALKRMSDGTYGTCERCGNVIATPRLEARPMSVYCVECAAIVS